MPMKRWMRSAPVVGGVAAWGASGVAVSLLGLGVPFMVGQVVGAIVAAVAIYSFADRGGAGAGASLPSPPGERGG